MDLLLKNVTIVDGWGSEPPENGVIAIRGERIDYAGRASDAPRDAGRVVQGGGRTA